MVIEGPPRPATWLPGTSWNLLESCGTLWNAVGALCGPRQPRPPLTESLWLPAGTWTQVPQRVCAGRRGCLEARTSSCREREDQGAVKHSRCPKPVDKVCGQPKQQEGNLSSDHIVPVKEATETQALVMAHASLNNKRSSLPLKASKNDKSRSLKKISREFINYMKRSRTFYASIAERLCEGDLVMKDSSTCWNGEDVVESYTSRVVSSGLKAQINNPELKVRGLDPLISNLIDKLQHFNQLDAEKAKLKLERWASRDAGSGGGRSEEMESSGDCDDEDGCQGSGDRIHTADILKDKKAHPENRNEPKPTVKKIDTTTTTSTVKSSSKHSVTGSGSNPAMSCSLVILTALAVLWHCPL